MTLIRPSVSRQQMNWERARAPASGITTGQLLILCPGERARRKTGTTTPRSSQYPHRLQGKGRSCRSSPCLE